MKENDWRTVWKLILSSEPPGKRKLWLGSSWRMGVSPSAFCQTHEATLWNAGHIVIVMMCALKYAERSPHTPSCMCSSTHKMNFLWCRLTWTWIQLTELNLSLISIGRGEFNQLSLMITREGFDGIYSSHFRYLWSLWMLNTSQNGCWNEGLGR